MAARLPCCSASQLLQGAVVEIVAMLSCVNLLQETQKAPLLELELQSACRINIVSTAESRWKHVFESGAHHHSVNNSLLRIVSASELKQEILEHEREMMRRIALRDSLRKAIGPSSTAAIATVISSLVETMTRECLSMVSRVSERVIDLQDRQVSLQLLRLFWTTWGWLEVLICQLIRNSRMICSPNLIAF